MNTTLDPLQTTPSHNTILPQRISSPLSNHTRQHRSSRSHSLELHVCRKLVIIRQQPDCLCRLCFTLAVLNDLLHLGFVETFADDDGDGAGGGGEQGG